MAGASVAVPKLSAGDTKCEKIVQLQQKIALRASEKGAPLVRVHDIPRGLGRGKKLSVGQKQWLKSTTFDGKIGNPVLAKQLKQYSTESVDVIERREAVLEVEGLSEQPLCQSSDGGRQRSDVMERVQRKRKIRHEQASGDLSQELATVGEDQSRKLTELSKQLKTFIAEKEHEIENLLRKNSFREALQQCHMEDLEEIWVEIEQLFILKRQRVVVFEGACDELETKRVATLLDIVKKYAVALTSIAYILPDEVERVMEEEAHTINMSILCNRRTYTQLCQHLVTTDYMMEKKTRQRWKELVADWKALMCQLLEEKFREFMLSDEVVSPEELAKLKNEFVNKIVSINNERESLLKQLCILRPSPTATSAVYEWRDSYLQLQQQLEEAYGQFLLGWQKCLDRISSKCEEELNQCKEYLGTSRAVESESKVFEILSSRFVPLLEQQQSRMADELKIMERSIEVSLASQGAQFQSLFQHAQGAAHLWTGHLTAMEQTRQAHKESLRSLRSQHDSKNQSKEARLDLVLDRLRQSSSSEELLDYLKQSLEMLESIKEGYTEFQQLLVTEAQQYPSQVQEVLNTYDTSICKYFGVGRTPSKKRKKSKIFPAKSSESPRSISRGGGRSTSSRAMSRTSSVGSVRSSMPPHSPLRSAIEEVISTSQGTSFYILTHSADSIESGPSIFLTQDEESEGVQVTFASEAIKLSETLFAESRKGLCASFLDHLESWRTDASERALDDTAGKEEELRNELELRLHLHEPRPSRVEDIHNTRSVELITHQSRVGKHANAITASLKELKALTEQLQTNLQEKVDSFSEEISVLETRLTSVTSMNRIEKILSQAKTVYDEHNQSVESVMNHHTEVVKRSLAELRKSNTAYHRSLRLFSQGGNYCPQEVDFISKKLDKLFVKMSTTQKLITRDAESYRETALERSMEIMTSRFDNSYCQNVNDVMFLEAIAKIFTNCQLRIKTEVAYCDTQSHKLSASVRRMKPTADQSNPQCPSDSPSSPSVLDELPGVLAAFSAYADYLYCWASYYQGARVGAGDNGRSAKRASVCVSAVNVTKSIMRYAGKSASAGAAVAEREIGRGGNGKGMISMTESTTTETKASESMGKISGKASVIKRKQLLAERMNISFGLGGGDDGSNCFLPNIRAILASSYRELYTTSEAYYKQKGCKVITRPDQIQENFQACMDHLIIQCQNYREQAETYRNNCIDEFHCHLSLLSDMLVSVAEMILGEVESRHWDAVQNKMAMLEAAYHNELTELARLKEEHVTQLRPGLGHPSRDAELAQLCAEEKTRYDRAIDCITQHISNMKVALEKEARLFAGDLVEVTQALLTHYNAAVSANDILPPKKTPPTTQQLLRELVHPQNNEERTAVKPTWPAISDHQLAFGDKLTIKKLGSTPVSTKVTTGHSSVVEARDKTYEKYKMVCLKRLQSVTEEDQLQRKKEEKASSVWATSVDRVRQLYK